MDDEYLCETCQGKGFSSDETICTNCCGKKKLNWLENIMGVKVEGESKVIELFNQFIAKAKACQSGKNYYKKVEHDFLEEFGPMFMSDDISQYPEPILNFAVRKIFDDEIVLPHYTESINFLVDGMYFDFYDLQMYELSHQNWCFYHSGNSLPDWFTDWAYEIESEKDPEVKKEIIDNLPEGRIRKMMLEYLDLPPDLTDEQELFKPEKDKNSKVDRYKKWFKEVE